MLQLRQLGLALDIKVEKLQSRDILQNIEETQVPSQVATKDKALGVKTLHIIFSVNFILEYCRRR